MLNLPKERIKEDEEIKVKKNVKKISAYFSSIMLRKLRLRQKNDFLTRKNVYAMNSVASTRPTPHLRHKVKHHQLT